MHDHTGRQTEETVELAHRGRVALGEVVVDGNDMHALAGQRIEVDRKGRHQRLAFTGLHFGDGALVQDHGTGQLHIKGSHVQNTARRLAGDGKSRDQQIVQRFAVRKLLAELRRLCRQRVVGKSLGGFLQRIDGCDLAFIGADAAFICRTEQFAGYSAEADHLTGPF